MTINPYQAPSLTAETSRATGTVYGGDLYVDGDVVVASVRGVAFPNSCVICNEAAEGYRLEQKLFWHPRWVFALVISPFIYAIVALLTRKKAHVSIGICPAHRRRRTTGRIAGACIVALGVVSCAAGAGTSSAELLLPFSVVLVALGFLAAALMGRTVTPQRIDESEVRMKTGRSFLESLR